MLTVGFCFISRLRYTQVRFWFEFSQCTYVSSSITIRHKLYIRGRHASSVRKELSCCAIFWSLIWGRFQWSTLWILHIMASNLCWTLDWCTWKFYFTSIEWSLYQTTLVNAYLQFSLFCYFWIHYLSRIDLSLTWNLSYNIDSPYMLCLHICYPNASQTNVLASAAVLTNLNRNNIYSCRFYLLTFNLPAK